MTIGDIAAEPAEAVDSLGQGPLDVLGVSTGGSISQQLAADHPGSVRRLVLASTGCHLSAMTKRMQAKVAHHIRAGERDLDDLDDLATTIEAEDEFDLASNSTSIEAPVPGQYWISRA